VAPGEQQLHRLLRFFERLAPGARQASPAVRAALPPRFAPGDSAGALSEEAKDVAARPGEPARQRQGDVAAAAPPQAERRSEERLLSAPLAQSRRPSLADAPDKSRPQSAAHPLDPAVLGIKDAAGNVHAEAPSRPLQRGIAARVAEADPPRAASRSIETSIESTDASFDASAWPAAEIQAPLSEAAVAQRAAPARAEAPTVVHVNIDRVDVRMPVAPAAAPKLTPKPRGASTVSLGDYLRQRDRGRSGGGTS